jgi:hypothetical protein
MVFFNKISKELGERGQTASSFCQRKKGILYQILKTMSLLRTVILKTRMDMEGLLISTLFKCSHLKIIGHYL